MPNNDAIEVLENLRELRQWRKENLPHFESPAAYDLIILLAINFAKGEVFTVKQLFASLPHSYTAIRQHYKGLMNIGLIECLPDTNDGRIKFIKPTEKFINLIDSYVSEVTARFPPHRSF